MPPPQPFMSDRKVSLLMDAAVTLEIPLVSVSLSAFDCLEIYFKSLPFYIFALSDGVTYTPDIFQFLFYFECLLEPKYIGRGLVQFMFSRLEYIVIIILNIKCNKNINGTF